MKKIISYILLVCIVLSSFAIGSVTAEEGLTEKQTMILKATGVFNEEYALDAKLSKAQFAEMVAKASYGDLDLTTLDISHLLPTDVDEFSDYANAVNSLYCKGCIRVDDFGRFFPENIITVNEAISMALRAMGYTEEHTKIAAGDDVAFATKRKLIKGINVLLSEELNTYSAYNLIYNMLYSDISDLYSDTRDELLFMSKNLNLHEVKGIVDDDGVISLTGKSKLSVNYIAIDGEVFVNECGYNNLFGQSILGIYKLNRRTDEKTLIAVCENVRKNSVTTLLSYDITELKNRTYYYYENEMSSKQKAIHVPSDAVIIYNEKELSLYDNFDDSMLLPQNARIRFYDNDNDGETDILRIENFNTGIVKSVDTDKEKVYINNSGLIDLQGKNVIVEYKDGALMKLGDVAKNNTVLYLESLDASIVKLVVSDDLYSDTIVSMESGSVTTVLTEAGAKYEFSEYAVSTCKSPDLGRLYKFYIDAFGRVAYYENDIMPNEYVYGCIAKLIYSDDLEPQDYGVKIFTQYGDKLNYKFAKKVLLTKEDGTEKYWDREDFPSQLTYRGVVRFKLNLDSEITAIELPHTKGTRPDKKNRLHYIVDSYTNSNGKDYYVYVSGDTINYGGAAMIDANTIVFHCPTDPTEMGDYAIGGASSFSKGVNKNLYAFGTDPTGRKAECVCIYESFVGAITSEYPSIVTDVRLVYDEKEAEVVYKITMLEYSNTEVDRYMKQDLYNNEVFATGAGVTTPLQISTGDIIYYASKDKYIQKASIVYDADHTVTDECGNTLTGAIAGTEISYFSSENLLCNPFYIADQNKQNTGSPNAWKFYTGAYKILTGWIYAVEDGYIQITTQNPAYGYDPDKTIEDGFITQIYGYGQEKFLTTTEIVRNNKMKVRPGKVSDLKSYIDYGADCSKIVWVQYLYANRFINIINN